MFGRKIVLLLCPFFIFSAHAALASTPKWVREFRLGASRIIKISYGDSYQSSQTSLRIMETTGKGNCVAWSKLMDKIAYEHKIKFNNYIVTKIYSRKENEPLAHQITILEDHSGQLWLQSNNFLRRVKNLDDALRVTAKNLMWDLGCSVSSRFVIRKRDLYKED